MCLFQVQDSIARDASITRFEVQTYKLSTTACLLAFTAMGYISKCSTWSTTSSHNFSSRRKSFFLDCCSSTFDADIYIHSRQIWPTGSVSI